MSLGWNNMYTLAFIIVSYGKSPTSSLTYCSLKRTLLLMDLNITKYFIYVFNNGPKEFEFKDDVCPVEYLYMQNPNNISLATIYNSSFSMVDSRYYVVLDDDTEITSDYVKDIINQYDFDLLCPKIFSNDKLVYPRINRVPVINDGLVDKKKLASITSGLVLSNGLINTFIEEYGSVFDERFAFYGVDSSFFLRLRRLKVNLKIVCFSKIHHSLSSDLKESSSVKEFREKERIYDLALQIKCYPRLSLLFITFRESIKVIKRRKNLSFFSDLIKTIKLGHHPRSTVK